MEWAQRMWESYCHRQFANRLSPTATWTSMLSVNYVSLMQTPLKLKLNLNYRGWALDRVHYSCRPLDRLFALCEPMAKFGDCSFSRFGFIVRTGRQTESRTDANEWSLYSRDYRRRRRVTKEYDGGRCHTTSDEDIVELLLLQRTVKCYYDHFTVLETKT